MIEEPDYKQFCPYCGQIEKYDIMQNLNGNWWHTINGYPQERCKASGMRKAYLDYRMKYIESPPLIQAVNKDGDIAGKTYDQLIEDNLKR
jgi:hypothetical protein